MADSTLRLIIQASGTDALRLGAGRLQVQSVSFKVERLFQNRPAGASFGVSSSDWFLAEAEPSDKNPWDAAHDGVMNGFGVGLSPVIWKNSLHLYPWPASWLFDRSLHFVSRLEGGVGAKGRPSGR